MVDWWSSGCWPPCWKVCLNKTRLCSAIARSWPAIYNTVVVCNPSIVACQVAMIMYLTRMHVWSCSAWISFQAFNTMIVVFHARMWLQEPTEPCKYIPVLYICVFCGHGNGMWESNRRTVVQLESLSTYRYRCMQFPTDMLCKLQTPRYKHALFNESDAPLAHVRQWERDEIFVMRLSKTNAAKAHCSWLHRLKKFSFE